MADNNAVLAGVGRLTRALGSNVCGIGYACLRLRYDVLGVLITHNPAPTRQQWRLLIFTPRRRRKRRHATGASLLFLLPQISILASLLNYRVVSFHLIVRCRRGGKGHRVALLGDSPPRGESGPGDVITFRDPHSLVSGHPSNPLISPD